MIAKSPTERSLEECRTRGWVPSVAEGWDRPQRGARKKDLFGFIDIVALDIDEAASWTRISGRVIKRSWAFVAIQCTSDDGGNVSARVKKSAALCEPWLRAGGRVLIWGWGKRWLKDSLGRRRQLWRCREIEIHAGNRESLCGDGLEVREVGSDAEVQRGEELLPPD